MPMYDRKAVRLVGEPFLPPGRIDFAKGQLQTIEFLRDGSKKDVLQSDIYDASEPDAFTRRAKPRRQHG